MKNLLIILAVVILVVAVNYYINRKPTYSCKSSLGKIDGLNYVFNHVNFDGYRYYAIFKPKQSDIDSEGGLLGLAESQFTEQREISKSNYDELSKCNK